MAPPDGQLDGLVCPLTGRSCQARSYADCREFWDCVRKAMDQQAEQSPGPPGSRGGQAGEEAQAQDGPSR